MKTTKRLTTSLTDQAKRELTPLRLRLATVTAISSDADGLLADIIFTDDGDGTPACRCLTPYVPEEDDVVRVLMTEGGGPLVIGTVSRKAPVVNKSNVYIERSTIIDFTSTAFASYGGLAMSFTKLNDDTMLSVSIVGSGFAYVTGSIGTGIGVLVAGTDYPIGKLFYNDAGKHLLFGGERILPVSLPKATYVVQARVKVSSGATFRHDTNDFASLTVEEVGG